MSKRYFKIDTGRYGGEVVVGTVSQEFVEYWADRVEEDGDGELIETLQRFEWDDDDMGDPDSPKPSEDFGAWFDCDDIEHVNGPFEDNQYHVTEIELHPDAEYVDGQISWKEGAEHDYPVAMYTEVAEHDESYHYFGLYGREAYCNYTEMPDDAENATVRPILSFLSSEKGGFGEVFVETDSSGYDPEMMYVGTVETDVGTIIERYWYGKQELVIDFDNADTNGKGYYAFVGFQNVAWHDAGYSQEQIDELLAETFDE